MFVGIGTLMWSASERTMNWYDKYDDVIDLWSICDIATWQDATKTHHIFKDLWRHLVTRSLADRIDVIGQWTGRPQADHMTPTQINVIG